MRSITLLIAGVALAVAACGGGDDGSADGSPLATGAELYRSTCSACHGSQGQGGVGRALDSVVADFPECSDQIRWTALGSSRWEAEVGPTFGATQTPVSGGMPGYEGVLSDEQIRAVSAHTRAAFGGQPEPEALDDCGA